MTRRRPDPLLCELHAHSRWSDGALSIRELADLYGRRGFDVLCITDHHLRLPPGAEASARVVTSSSHQAYLEAIEDEAKRARELYDLLLVPGLELTYDDTDPCRSAHAVAVGLRTWTSLEHGLDAALAEAREAGAALIAAHPYEPAAAAHARRTTGRWAVDPTRSARLVDRFELFNRHDFFGWVARERLPGIASGDFHRTEHLATWKTLVPCLKEEAALVDYLRSQRPTYLLDLAESSTRPIAA